VLQCQGRLRGHQPLTADQQALVLQRFYPHLDGRDGNGTAAFKRRADKVVAPECCLALA
jgi:hypothetical protein